ncbi:hypothetical protein [Chryseobacterium polytrichastri]|uniref:Uncharacterized protein n=1 Tax=Chryseobacterium polytrichastri TaxID=1302687 RepID=A0A1M6X1U6_9FLAO|nr:hypothetical protein [Chryseobacterium polytrichastri]SHK99894.1 hypothetical protein SAMN05444267_101064 [Chryseobacterium polytrichastri]
MEIFSLRILTIINLLYFLRVLIVLMILGIFSILLYVFKFEDSSDLVAWILGIVAICFGRDFFNYLKKIIISKTKHPLPLNLLCNILDIGKPYYFGKDKFDLDEIINDNKLPLTFYYINNLQHPILQFNKGKILFHNQEYDWKDFSWKYFFYSENPNSYRAQGEYLIEFTGPNQDNIRIKNKIEFGKIKAKENEVILLFIIHDLLFGKRSSFYY